MSACSTGNPLLRGCSEGQRVLWPDRPDLAACRADRAACDRPGSLQRDLRPQGRESLERCHTARRAKPLGAYRRRPLRGPCSGCRWRTEEGRWRRGLGDTAPRPQQNLPGDASRCSRASLITSSETAAPLTRRLNDGISRCSAGHTAASWRNASRLGSAVSLPKKTRSFGAPPRSSISSGPTAVTVLGIQVAPISWASLQPAVTARTFRERCSNRLVAQASARQCRGPSQPLIDGGAAQVAPTKAVLEIKDRHPPKGQIRVKGPGSDEDHGVDDPSFSRRATGSESTTWPTRPPAFRSMICRH